MSKAANARYDAGHTTQVKLKLNTGTDADILRYLDGKSKQTIIKLALREYMENHKND